MKTKDYRKMSKEKLEKELANLQLQKIKAGGTMGFAKLGRSKQKSTGSIGDDMQKRLRKEVARIKTIIREKDVANDTESDRFK